MRVAPLLGIAHKLDEGARRSLPASPTAPCAAESSTPGTEKGLTGPVVDQADIFGDLASPTVQDSADETIHPGAERSVLRR
jgi:hypothetical protein